jgi:hypothetical protein
MSYKIRYILLAVTNCALLLGFLYFGFSRGWDLSKRLIDIQLNNPQDLTIVFTLFGLLVFALLVNILLISPGKEEAREDEVKKLINAL